MVVSYNILKIIEKYNVNRQIYINDASNNIYINKFVDKIYIINLDGDNIRKKYIITLMKKYSINFEFIIVPRITQTEYESIPNMKITKSELGCLISHLYCLNDSIQNNYENIIIFEDDIVLHKNFHTLFETVTLNQKYNLLMLGVSDFNFVNEKYKLKNNTTNKYKPNIDNYSLLGTHAILYSLEACKFVFETRIKDVTFYDDKLIQFFNNFEEDSFICYPNLAVVELSTTNLNHNFWIFYNESKEKHYYRNCFNNIFNFEDYNFIYLDLFLNIYHIINHNLTYKDNINKILNTKYRHKSHLHHIIRQRLVYDFFDVDDLLYIMN
jgi:GR25 family glycosyltransferase involved in LPS biosynthesis